MAKEKVVEEATSTTVQIVDKLINSVGPFIKELASGLGTTSEKVMVILTKQAYADAIEGFCTVIICAVVAYGWYRFALLWANRMDNGNWSSEGWVPLGIFSCVIGFMTFIIASSCCVGAVKRLFNPEFYALKIVLDYIEKFSG